MPIVQNMVVERIFFAKHAILTYFSIKNRDMRLTFILAAIVLFSACQPSEQDTKQTAQEKTDNLYKKYHVKKMMQYAHDLAFYEPEDKGRLIQSYFFNRDGEIIKVIRYDKSGNICYTEKIDPEKDAGSNKLIIKKHKSDSLTVKNYGPQGKLRNKVAHTYNEKGQKKSMIRKNDNGEIVEKITYDYYSNGLLKQDIYWNMEIKQPQNIINYQYEYY